MVKGVRLPRQKITAIGVFYALSLLKIRFIDVNSLSNISLV